MPRFLIRTSLVLPRASCRALSVLVSVLVSALHQVPGRMRQA
jgi:hypothetical protein